MNKIEMFQNLIHPQEESLNLVNTLLEQAERIVLNRRYPFGYPEGTKVPKKYDMIQVRIAVELYAKMGAEGETAHTENGITRNYASTDVSHALLRQIVPLVGSVTPNE